MSIAALNWVKSMHKSRIKPTPRSVLREMADFADEQDECWPSVETLSNCTSLSERAVQEALRVLEQQGLITTRRRAQTSSRYRLNREIDLSRPAVGADGAPSRGRNRKPSEKPRVYLRSSEIMKSHSPLGADGAPTLPGPVEGAPFATSRVQISSFEGAPAAPEPPENHHRTTRERGANARPTPLPPDWQPGEEDAAYARRLGLDPVSLALRFRKTFLASGKRLADWSARWELWCDEDAAEKGTSPAAATTATPASSIERDERGLTAGDRGWLAKWRAKRDAGEHPGQLEELLGRMLTPEGKAELRRLKAELSQAPGTAPEIFWSLPRKHGNFFTHP